MEEPITNNLNQTTNPEELDTFGQLIHSDMQVRLTAYKKLTENDASKNKEEIVNYLKNDYDIIFNETSPEIQKSTLALYTKIIRNKEIEVDFSKRSFWYNFMDKYLSSRKKEIRLEAKKFKTEIFTLVDKETYLSHSLIFLMKNNIKVNKQIFKSLNDSFADFNFEPKIPELVPALDKNIGNANGELRNLTFQFIKLLVQNTGMDFITDLKKLKKEHLEELETIVPKEKPKQVKKSTGDIFQTAALNYMSNEEYRKAKGINLLQKYNNQWTDSVVDLKKWNLRKQKVDAFLEDANTPRLAQGDYSHLFQLGKRLVKDYNLQVQICGLKIIGTLAKGLRSSIRSYVKSNMDILIEKLKVRKTILADNLLETFNSVFYILSAEELYNELKVFNKERNKDIRFNVIKIVKNYFDFILLTEDNNLMGSFISLFSKILNCYFDDKDSVIRNLNNELVLYIQEKLKDEEELVDFNSCVNLSRVKRKGKKNNFERSASKGRSAKSLTPVKKDKRNPMQIEMETPEFKTSPNKLEVESSHIADFKVPFDIADEKMFDLFEYDIINGFKSEEWKTKLQSIKDINKKITSKETDTSSHSAGCICKFFDRETKGFTESNIMIVKEVFVLLENLIKQVEDSKPLLGFAAKLICNKAGETKFKTEVETLISLLTIKLPFHIVFGNIVKPVLEKSNSNTLTKLNTIFENLVTEESNFVLGDIRKYFSAVLNNTNINCRNSGLSFLRKYGRNFPEKLKKLSEFVSNDNFKKTVLNELKDIIPQSKETFKKPRKSRIKTESREKLSQSFTDIIDNMKNSDWKTKHKAIEEYYNYLNENPETLNTANLKSTYNFLRERINDSHKAISSYAVSTLKKLLESHFQKFKSQHKQILTDTLSLLNDKSVG